MKHTIERRSTRGGRYSITLCDDGDDRFSVREYTHNEQVCAACGLTLDDAQFEIERRVYWAKQIDNIHYTRVV